MYYAVNQSEFPEKIIVSKMSDGNIYVVGDAHGRIEKIKDIYDRIEPELKDGKKHVMLIAGDFGFVWDRNQSSYYEKNNLDYLEKIAQQIRIAFVDGNHENFDRINELPERTQIFGENPVGVVRDGVYHLKRGYVYSINGFTFFSFGGAASLDRGPACGKNEDENICWWRQEIPSEEEMDHGRELLRINNNRVDFIITHTVPTSILGKAEKAPNIFDRNLTDYFDDISKKISFEQWFGGHLHMDRNYDNIALIYNDIIKIDKYKNVCRLK